MLGGIALAMSAGLVTPALAAGPTVIVDPDAPPQTQQAAQELARVLALALKLDQPVAILADAPSDDAGQARRFWVGRSPGLAKAFPEAGVNLDTPGEEEILILIRGRDVAMLGNDQMAGKAVLQAGTSLAAYTFMQRNLGVRWFWPGELGEEIPDASTWKLQDEAWRYTPQVHGRWLRLFPREKLLPASVRADDPQRLAARQWDQQVADWFRRNRGGGSFKMIAGHAYGDWAQKYHKDRPELFALQPDGTRSIYPTPKNAKLCISNPQVAALWLQGVNDLLQRAPHRDMFSASPNDSAYSGFCTCDTCQAWDAPDAPTVTLQWKGVEKQAPALTDRYAHFWNNLAGQLRQAHPGRKLYIGVWAYGAMRTAPVRTKLDDTIRVGFVGNLSWGDESSRQRDLKLWDQWATQVSQMAWRPNLFHYGWAMPGTMIHGLSDDFKHLAARGLLGIDIDSIYNDWAVRGLDYYALAHLAWDPSQDAGALREDYITRAFGLAAAPDMRDWFDALEKSHHELAQKKAGKTRYEMVDVDLAHFTPELMRSLAASLQQAAEAADADAAATPRQRQRIAFVRQGLAFSQMHLEVAHTLARLRTGQGDRRQLLAQAVHVMGKRDQLGQELGEQFVVGWWPYQNQLRVRKMATYLGPLDARDVSLLKDTSLIPLPGQWDFAIDPQKRGQSLDWHSAADLSGEPWRKISIYDVWGPQLKGDEPVDLDNPVDKTYNGDAWYRTRFNAPSLQPGQRLWLELPAVDKSLVVYLNGKALATQMYDAKVDPDAWTKPRRFNLTDALRAGGNLLAIKVTSEIGAGGIYRGAFLRVLTPSVLADGKVADHPKAWKTEAEQAVETTLIPGLFVGEQALRLSAKGAARLSLASSQPLQPGDYRLVARWRIHSVNGSDLPPAKALALRLTLVPQDKDQQPVRVWLNAGGVGQWETQEKDFTLAFPVRTVAVRVFIAGQGTYDLDEVTLSPR